MPDQVSSAKPRVALIYGDVAAVGHVREALADQVDIAYDTQAGEFDATRLVASGARAALVNLDSYEWLDTLTAQLGKAGVEVVFNDPETSIQLEGWERARWLRHLVAKLRGSEDFDPPRPVAVPVEHPAVFTPTGESVAILEPAPAQPHSVAPVTVARAEPSNLPMVGEPLVAGIAAPAANPSPVATTPVPVAIEAMAPASAAAESGFSPGTVEPAVAAPVIHEPVAAPAVDAPATSATFDADVIPAAPETPHLVAASDDFDAALDVDTEALSAMIDARLAEPEAHALPSAEADLAAAPTVDAVLPDATDGATPMADAAATPVAIEAAATPVTVPASPTDDSDVLADLPALGDWELVDPEAPIAAKAKPAAHAEPSLGDELAGLELVPMEDITPIELHTEPIEHRLYVEDRKKTESANHDAAAAKGDHA